MCGGLVQFAREALDFYRDNYGAPLVAADDWQEDWVRRDAEYFVAQSPLVWQRPAVDIIGERLALSELATFARLVEVWRAEPWLNQQVGGQVGTFFSRRMVELPALLDGYLIYPLVVEHESFDVSPESIQSAAGTILKTFRSTELPHRFLVPLLGLRMHDPVRLSDDVVVRELSDDEITTLLMMNALPMVVESTNTRRVRPEFQYALVWIVSCRR